MEALLCDFWTRMLYSCNLTIFTKEDQENLTYANLNSQYVLCWLVFIEEYGWRLAYIKGQDNTLAEFFPVQLPLWKGRKRPVHMAKGIILTNQMKRYGLWISRNSTTLVIAILQFGTIKCFTSVICLK